MAEETAWLHKPCRFPPYRLNHSGFKVISKYLRIFPIDFFNPIIYNVVNIIGKGADYIGEQVSDCRLLPNFCGR